MTRKRKLKAQEKRHWEELDPWLWCLHCERCYEMSNFLKIDGVDMCHYEDCDGSRLADGWLWEEVRRLHPEYPKRPKMDKVYPLYDISANLKPKASSTIR